MLFLRISNKLAVQIASLATIAMFTGWETRAAEIVLRPACQADGSLVVLGDIAEILSNDAEEAEQLAQCELIPAPAPGTSRFLRNREIQDLLVGRGWNLAEHRFGGANQVAIVSAIEKEVAPAPRPTLGLDPRDMAHEAILQHLRSAASASTAWRVDIRLTAAAQKTLAQATDEVRATGGEAPWSGSQDFALLIPVGDDVRRVELTATVAQPTTVVVVKRTLPRGSILHAQDVEVVEQGSTVNYVQAEETFHAIEDVVGKETTRSVTPGQVLDANYVRRPLLVQRGEVVTVYARAAGIRVRTTGRALEDGSQGSLISIETLDTGKRDKFDARVTGAQTVEIWAGAIPGGGSAR